MSRYVCVHGHFYQPPRENPWLEAVEVQDSAWPFHDWNERVTHECYAQNAASRILDREERIESIVNNYARISFDFGPTLLAWMERQAPEVYAAVLEADRESRARFGGHGAAMAQAHGHLILPLANARDRLTQVRWGVRDFERRFGRAPEGMWLPETAVDAPTLEALAAEGIRFTVLAPHQARRVRRKGAADDDWRAPGANGIDTTRAYEAPLPSGRRLAVFFYDGAVSRAVAFERLLASGAAFAGRLVDAFRGRPGAELVHIATDGESYGHHHRHGDMALAWALRHLEREGQAALTCYGEFLERHPPDHEVEVVEGTAWSCAHGLERWRSDCGCATGARPDWRQHWRAPLRAALDALRDAVLVRWEAEARRLLADPWGARDAYVDVLLDRAPASVARFLERHAARPLSDEERVRALELLELQRHAMAMYTSCGWFFDDVSGIETVQVLRHAGRAAQLAERALGGHFEALLLEGLEKAPSNDPGAGDGRRVYERHVRPADWETIGAHWAVTSLFAAGERERLYCYAVDRKEERVLRAGAARLALGRARFTSELTRESALLAWTVLHLGDHNLEAAVRRLEEEAPPGAGAAAEEALEGAFLRADLAEVLRLLHRARDGETLSLRSLFRDDRRAVLEAVLAGNLAEVEQACARLVESRAPLLRFLAGLEVPLPASLKSVAQVVMNARLRESLAGPRPDLERVASILAEATEGGIALDGPGIGYAVRQALERLMDELLARPAEVERLVQMELAVTLAGGARLEVDLWRVQNGFFRLLQAAYPERRDRARGGDADALAWVRPFRALGERLRIRVD